MSFFSSSIMKHYANDKKSPPQINKQKINPCPEIHLHMNEYEPSKKMHLAKKMHLKFCSHELIHQTKTMTQKECQISHNVIRKTF